MRCREEQPPLRRFSEEQLPTVRNCSTPEAISKLTLVESASLKLNTHEEAGVCIPKTKTDEIS